MGVQAAKMQCLIGRDMLACVCVLFTWCFCDGHHWILTGAIGDVLAIARSAYLIFRLIRLLFFSQNSVFLSQQFSRNSVFQPILAKRTVFFCLIGSAIYMLASRSSAVV